HFGSDGAVNSSRPVYGQNQSYHRQDTYHGPYQSQSAPPPPVRAHSVQQHHSFPNEFDTSYPGYPQPSHSSMSNYPEANGGYTRRRLASYPMHEPPAHLFQHRNRSYTPYLSQHTEEEEGPLDH